MCLRELLLHQYHVIDIQIFCVFNVPLYLHIHIITKFKVNYLEYYIPQRLFLA